MIRKYFKRNKPFLFLLILIIFAGNLASYPVQAAKDRTAPSAPTNLSAGSITSSSITLFWNASTDNTGVKSYAVYKNSVYVGTSYTTSYTVSGLTPSTSYQFYVIAKDNQGNSSLKSNILTVSTLATQTPMPTPTATPDRKSVV